MTEIEEIKMTVDRDEKIWAFSSTGNKMHAFVQVWSDKDGVESANHLRAMCRGTIARPKNSTFVGQNHVHAQTWACGRCLTLAEAMWDRKEASMEPATEAHDLGYVPSAKPEGRLDDSSRDRLQDLFDAEVARVQAEAAAKDETVTIQGGPVETLADAQAIVVKELRHAFQDAAHAEALEMDADPLTVAHREAMTLLDDAPGRWSYRAHVMSPSGQFLGISEGYISAHSEELARDRIHRLHQKDRGVLDTVLGNLVLTRITRTRRDTL